MMVRDKNDPNYRQCSLSVMDNIADPDITFDENGICNYYYEYLLKRPKDDTIKEFIKEDIIIDDYTLYILNAFTNPRMNVPESIKILLSFMEKLKYQL